MVPHSRGRPVLEDHHESKDSLGHFHQILEDFKQDPGDKVGVLGYQAPRACLDRQSNRSLEPP